MAGIDYSRIMYTLLQRTQSWLSGASGVPQSTLSYVARGLRDLPQEYSESIRNIYQSEAYGRLRESGLSSTQSNRFKWYSPASVLNVESAVQLKVNDWTIGAVGSKLIGLRRSPTEKEVMDIWDELHEKVRDALQKSKEPYERIMEDIT